MVQGEPARVPDGVGAAAVFGPVSFFPVVQRQDLATAFENPRPIAVDVDLVKPRQDTQPRGRETRDAFVNLVVAESHPRVGFAIVEVRVRRDGGGEGNAEENPAAAHGDEAVEDDGPPFFGEGAEVERLRGVVFREGGKQGGHGGDEGVVVDEGEPFSKTRFDVGVQDFYEGEVAFYAVVFAVERFYEGGC